MFYPRVQSAFIKPRLRLMEKVGGPFDPNAPFDPKQLDKEARLETSSSLGWVMETIMKLVRK